MLYFFQKWYKINSGKLELEEGKAKLEESKEEHTKLENVIMGTGNVAKMLQEKKKQALIAKFQEVKDEFVEKLIEEDLKF